VRTQQARLSFAGGELSPRASLRADAPKYNESCRTLRNFVVTPQGGAMFREGMRKVDVPTQDQLFRTFQFHRGGDESDILIEVEEGSLRFRVDDSLLSDTGTNDYTLAELSALWFTNQERLGILLQVNHPPIYITQHSDGEITTEELEFSKIPVTEYKDRKSPSVASADTTYEITFNSFAAFDEYVVSYGGILAESGLPEPQPIRWRFSSDDTVNESDIFNALSSISLLQGAGTTIGAVSTTTPGSVYEVTITGENAGRDMVLYPTDPDNAGPIDIEATGILNPGEEPAWSFPYVVQNGSNYYKCLQPHKSDGVADDIDEPGSGSSWTDYWEDLGTTAPDWWAWQHDSSNDWAEDTVYAPWDRGFPTVGVFHEQRLILAGAKDASTTLWGSRIASYDDFIGGSNASDPFEFSLDTTDTPAIRWMASQLNLMIGTSSGDWNISAEVSLGPGDISAVKQNGARSYFTKPVVIDTELFYVEQGQTKLRATRYVRDYNSFSSLEASWMAEHLLAPGIKRVVPFYVPEVVLFMLTEDGELVMMGMNKSAESVPWSGAGTDDVIHDICAYYNATTKEEELYLVVERGDSYYLEHMPYPTRTFGSGTYASQGICHMDAWVTGTVTGEQISGIDHLEGREVGVLIGDALLEGTYTVDNGLILLPEDRDGEEFTVGLMYHEDSLIHTQEVVRGHPMGIGFGMDRRWPELTVRCLDSSLPEVDGELPPDRTPSTPMGTAETQRTGLQDHEFSNVGHEDGSVPIKPSGPYPLHVVGMFGRFESNNA